MAKIEGRNMWFVYEVSIGGDEDLPVDYMKSTESEVQTRMPPRPHVSYPELVTVRVKTHFENSKHIQAVKVHTETTVRTFKMFTNLIRHPQFYTSQSAG